MGASPESLKSFSERFLFMRSYTGLEKFFLNFVVN